MKIVLILPSRRLWRWHAKLVAELAKRGGLEVRLAPSRPYPLATRSWLAFERMVFGRREAVPIRSGALGAAAAPWSDDAVPVCDLLVDLSGLTRESAYRRLSLRFSGQADEAALFASLQARRPPRLDVVEDDGRAVASSQSAMEVRDELGRSLGDIHARLLALVLRAVEGGRSPANALPAAAARDGATLGDLREPCPARQDRRQAVRRAQRRRDLARRYPARARDRRRGSAKPRRL